MAREHYDLVHALRDMAKPEFTETVRRTLSGFAYRWISAITGDGNLDAEAASVSNR